MAADVTITPNPAKVGSAVTLVGTGFLPTTKVSVKIPEYGFEDDQTTDVSGAFGSDDLADKAVGLLTSDATNVTAADTVTVGAVTYTFRAAVTTTANEVKIGADAATTLANLKSAINADGNTAVYGSLTVVNPDVTAGVLTATTLALYAKVGGTAGNALATTETSSHLSYGATTLTGGAVPTTVSPLKFTPQNTSPFTVVASDGTSTVTKTVTVFTE